jgi:repressor LexA
MEALTSRQQICLDIIQRSIENRGYPPTLREIGAQMGIGSTNGVTDHIKSLERKGFLHRDPLKSRGLRPTRTLPPVAAVPVDPAGQVHVPVMSRIAAGLPLVNHEYLVDEISMEAAMLRSAAGDEIFGLRMYGEAMIDAGIIEGDYVLARKQMGARNGDTVIVLLGEEALVRRYYRTPLQVQLQPANRAMPTIHVQIADFKPHMIVGVVVGMFRRLRPGT